MDRPLRACPRYGRDVSRPDPSRPPEEEGTLIERSQAAERAARAYAGDAAPPLPGRRPPLPRVHPGAPGGNPFAYLWPFEEAAKATLCMRGLPDLGRQYADDLEDVVDRQAYWQPMRVSGIVRKPSYASYPPLPLGHGGDTYFDDNTWVALDLVQAHRMRVAGLMRRPGGRARAGARPLRAGSRGLVPGCSPVPRRRLLGRCRLESRSGRGGDGRARRRWRSTSTS